MNWRLLVIVLVGLVLLGLLGWLLIGGGSRPAPREEGAGIGPVPTPSPAPHQQVVLLFTGTDGQLHPELRAVPLPQELEARVRVVLGELLKGPTAGLLPVVPYAAELNAVYLDGAGNAFVDLTAPPKPLTGSNTELVLAYGVVDSVLLNCPELHAVQILFGGREVQTLTGHLDLSHPLVLNKGFIGA